MSPASAQIMPEALENVWIEEMVNDMKAKKPSLWIMPGILVNGDYKLVEGTGGTQLKKRSRVQKDMHICRS
jgi:hypothetical protein